jgi:hypothetical protein
MQEDIDYYLTFLDENHPDLYRRYTPAQFDSTKQVVISGCQKPLSVNDFTRKLFKFNKLTDGHTKIIMNGLWENYEKIPYFPYFEIHNDSVLIKNKLLLTVNDFDVTELILDIMNNMSWENHPKTNEMFVNQCLFFFLSAFYNITPPYMLQLKDIQTEEITREKVETSYRNYISKNFPVEVEFYKKYLIAVIHYKTCEFEGEMKRIILLGIRQAFQRMKNEKIKYLFIDVSKNGGGSNLNNEIILQYLKSTKFKGYYINKLTKNKVDAIFADVQKQSSYYHEKYKKNIFMDAKLKDEIKKENKKLNYITPIDISKNKIIINENRMGYKGKVFVIQSKQTYSAAIQFCESIKQRQMGIIIGEEAGEPIGFCGNVKISDLPNSKISFSYSSACGWYEPPIPTKNGFIVPDIPYDVFDENMDMNNNKLTIDDYKKIIELSKNLKK